ncbi:cystathionine beta-lyase [Methylobacterium sp. WL30]|uniref:cystathionine beta-lyase n=1 Tax=unclassified Methylobacterium TaxID=2615210 RepID=UPI0011C79E59|nr:MULTISPECIES: cystathionine beta-lyase [unclassified Methylobacterium]MCJ2008989.1 cystathionine beta-lyase [Methylobacterium sp. J-092]MCJ2039618.1 cystathionine beta-lyase [Methylobacterium sp. J-059]MCJ2077442.1 cystathionine beta-lyase [Methylobacterium sp. E-016]MCJ2113940.1 cystathionine beta-lyase [Methylobacterium sp. E-025]TXM91613.1 cystathionine beta-lyase [Methylobacterium sp. WL116]
MSKPSSKTAESFGVATRLVHAGRDPSAQHGFVNTPIYRGSTVLYPTYDDIVHRRGRYNYGTSGTPTMDALTDAWSEVAGAAGTVATPSGLCALTVALMASVSAGDHLLVTDSAYRPTRIFCDGLLARFGVETTYYDPLVGAGIAGLMRDNTKAVLVEAPGSQSFEMQDVPAIADAVHARGGTVIMDNTWATPLLFPPHARGVDIAVEAGTKYLSGGSDLLLGLTSANAAHFPAVRRTFDQIAPCAGPEDLFLALRGLRTMNLRLREHGRAGLEMARWLQERPEVLRVLHPGLPEDPGHAIWKRDFSGASGLFGVVLEPVSETALAAMLDGLELFGMGFSWGGFESLVIPFDCRPYRTATQWAPGGPALRFHIGLEDVADLKADLDAGFARLRAAA